MFVQCTLVKLSSWFTSSWGVLVYSSGLSYSLQWRYGFQNSLHWETRWFSLQRGKRLVALGRFQTLADCKSTTKLVVFRLVINHFSCPCIFIFVFCLCLKNYFPTEIQFCFFFPWFVLLPSGVGCSQACAGHTMCFKLTIDGATILHN